MYMVVRYGIIRDGWLHNNYLFTYSSIDLLFETTRESNKLVNNGAYILYILFKYRVK